MLNENQIVDIATTLNQKVDLPFLSEEKEQDILEGVVGKVGERLSDVTGDLPEPIQDIWDRLTDGISDDDAEELINHLTDLANERIDIPLLDEDSEASMIIRPVVSAIVGTLRGE